MLVSNAKTWTIVLILYVLPKCAFSAVLEDRAMTPKTLYQTLVATFPQIENLTLRKTLDEVFSSQCNNWTAIERAKPILQDKDYVSCRLLYESIKAFFTKVEKNVTLPKSLFDNILTTNHTLQDICLSNKSLSSNFSALSTIEGFSSYIDEVVCILTCVGDLSKFVTNQSLDACKAAYFFATFDLPKFLNKSESLWKESENQAPISEDESKTQNNKSLDNKLPAIVEVQKSKYTHSNDESVDHFEGGQQPLTNNPKLVTGQEQSGNVKSVHKLQDKLNNNDGKGENGPVRIEEFVDESAVSNTRSETKPLSKPDIFQENSPNSVVNDLSNADKTSVESDNNDRENQEDNLQENDNLRDQVDSGATGDDLENTKQNENTKPVNLQQTESKEPSVKKMKPSTLGVDEPVSSDNIDDDMNGDSYFFSYFTVFMCLVIVGYVGYHNRQKVVALLLEGKRGKRNGRNIRRPNSANYHKLDSNLEEAMSSSCTKNASNVIY